MLHLIAFRNVKVHWRQSLAALLSISAAFFSFVLFQGYMLDVERLYLDGYRNRSMYGDVIVENKYAFASKASQDPWKYELSAQDQEIISRAIAHRKEKLAGNVRFLNFQGLVATGTSSKIFLAQATDVDRGAQVREQWIWNVLYGEPLHVSKAAAPVIMGQGLGFQIGCEPIRKIYSLRPEGGYPPEVREFSCRRPDIQISVTTEGGNLNAMDFEVVGLMDAGYKDIDSRYLMMPLPLAQQLLNTDRISLWTLKLKDQVNKKDFVRDFHAEISAQNPDLRAVDWVDHQAGDLFKKTMSLLNIFRNFVTIVVAFISVLSVMNTMVKIVKERTREIGTLLSLGFQRTQVMGIFLLEALFLATLGCLLGALISVVSSLILNAVGITYKAGILSQPVYFQVDINLGLYLTAVALLLTVTVLTSYLTCRSTVQRKIVECLGSV